MFGDLDSPLKASREFGSISNSKLV